VKLTVVDQDNDMSTVTKSNFISVAIDLLPVADFNANATIIFSGRSVLFSYSGSTGNGISSYQWSFGDATANATGQNPVHRFTTAGTRNITLTVVDVDGDADTEVKVGYITVNADIQAPVMENVTIDAIKVYNAPVSTSIDVSDTESGVASVELWYAVNQNVTFSRLTMTHGAGNTYSVQIPAQNFGVVVYYYYRAVDYADNSNTVNNASHNYLYHLDYLDGGLYTIAFTSPLALTVILMVTDPGRMSLELYTTAGLATTLGLTAILASFNLTFTGNFSSLQVLYTTSTPISSSMARVYHYHSGSWVSVTPIVAGNTISFSLSGLSPIVIGLVEEPGFDFMKFLADNWMLISIIGIGLMIAIIGGSVAARRKKTKAAAKTKAITSKAPSKGKVVQQPAWIQPATQTMLTLDDVKSRLKHLFVFHARTGVCLFYQPFSDVTIDPQLIAGFISAISSFGASFEKEAELRVLEYKSFKILMEETMACKYAMLFSGDMNDKLNELLKAFIGEFESKFRKPLSEFNGNISVFSFASQIMANVFKIPAPVASDELALNLGGPEGVPEPSKPFNLFCPGCEIWTEKHAGITVSGGETCKKCGQGLFFVPKCDRCGNGFVLPVSEFNSFKKSPRKCDRCNVPLRIQ
jgi:PKD repeat protein